MPDFWLSIIGAVTGTIGAVTGIVGAILGYRGYRSSKNVKALDLRLELRRAESDLRAGVEELPGLMEHAKNSRMEVASATEHRPLDELENLRTAGTGDDDRAHVSRTRHAAMVAGAS